MPRARSRGAWRHRRQAPSARVTTYCECLVAALAPTRDHGSSYTGRQEHERRRLRRRRRTRIGRRRITGRSRRRLGSRRRISGRSWRRLGCRRRITGRSRRRLGSRRRISGRSWRRLGSRRSFGCRRRFRSRWDGRVLDITTTTATGSAVGTLGEARCRSQGKHGESKGQALERQNYVRHCFCLLSSFSPLGRRQEQASCLAGKFRQTPATRGEASSLR